MQSKYRQELAVKRAILTDLACTSSRDTAMVYLATWQMQPYLSQGAAFKAVLVAEIE